MTAIREKQWACSGKVRGGSELWETVIACHSREQGDSDVADGTVLSQCLVSEAVGKSHLCVSAQRMIH